MACAFGTAPGLCRRSAPVGAGGETRTRRVCFVLKRETNRRRIPRLSQAAVGLATTPSRAARFAGCGVKVEGRGLSIQSTAAGYDVHIERML